MTYNSETHHRKSIRLKGYDYSQNGAYFVTICVQNKECLFGDVENGKMVLNKLGEVANEYWKKIEELHDFVKLDSFVIMPNHMHGIISIDNPNKIDGDSVGGGQWPPPTTNIKNLKMPAKGIPS